MYLFYGGARTAPVVATAVLVAAFAGSKLDALDEGLNVLQSIQLPFALLPVLKFTSNVRLMGEFVNQWWLTALCWGLALMVLVINAFQVVDLVFVAYDSHWAVITAASIIGFLYIAFVLYLSLHDVPFVAMLWDRLYSMVSGSKSRGGASISIND